MKTRWIASLILLTCIGLQAGIVINGAVGNSTFSSKTSSIMKTEQSINELQAVSSNLSSEILRYALNHPNSRSPIDKDVNALQQGLDQVMISNNLPDPKPIKISLSIINTLPAAIDLMTENNEHNSTSLANVSSEMVAKIGSELGLADRSLRSNYIDHLSSADNSHSKVTLLIEIAILIAALIATIAMVLTRGAVAIKTLSVVHSGGGSMSSNHPSSDKDNENSGSLNQTLHNARLAFSNGLVELLALRDNPDPTVKKALSIFANHGKECASLLKKAETLPLEYVYLPELPHNVLIHPKMLRSMFKVMNEHPDMPALPGFIEEKILHETQTEQTDAETIATVVAPEMQAEDDLQSEEESIEITPELYESDEAQSSEITEEAHASEDREDIAMESELIDQEEETQIDPFLDDAVVQHTTDEDLRRTILSEEEPETFVVESPQLEKTVKLDTQTEIEAEAEAEESVLQ